MFRPWLLILCSIATIPRQKFLCLWWQAALCLSLSWSQRLSVCRCSLRSTHWRPLCCLAYWRQISSWTYDMRILWQYPLHWTPNGVLGGWGKNVVWKTRCQCWKRRERWRGVDTDLQGTKTSYQIHEYHRRLRRNQWRVEWFTLIIFVKWRGYLGVIQYHFSFIPDFIFFWFCYHENGLITCSRVFGSIEFSGTFSFYTCSIL